MASVYGVLVLVLKFWLPNSGEALGADGDRHSQFPNSAHVMAFYWQLTITDTDSVAARWQMASNPICCGLISYCSPI